MINLFGNLFIEESVLSASTINFMLFILVHAFTFRFIKIKSAPSKSLIYVQYQPIFLALFIFFSMLLIGYFFWHVGLLVFQDDILASRKALGFGRGIFSRVILHFFPVFSGFSLMIFLRNHKRAYLIPPILCLTAILLTGYRGFIFFNLLYFAMLWSLGSRGMPSINAFTLIILSVIFYVTFSVTSEMSDNGLALSESILRFGSRIFFDNVYGYNVLVNNVQNGMVVNVWNTKELAHDLFVAEFGLSGKIAQLGVN